MYRTDENSPPFFLLFLVISFALYVYRSKPFSSPAAVGLGLASLSVILGLCVYTVSYFDDLEEFSARGIALYPLTGLLSVIVSLLLAGYSASKTWEDTVTMNVKIVMGAGLIPFIFIALISFSNISLWFVLACLVMYCPTIWGGHLLLKYHNTRYVSGHENS